MQDSDFRHNEATVGSGGDRRCEVAEERVCNLTSMHIIHCVDKLASVKCKLLVPVCPS